MSLTRLHNLMLPAQHSYEDARQYAYRIIKAYILDFTFPPDQKMNEADFASALNISRTPIHDTFVRLSRENLVDIIPQRGAFVSKLDMKRIENAIWIHSVLGRDTIHTIFIKNIKKDDISVLTKDINQLQKCLESHTYNNIAPTIFHYYNQLFELAGDMDFIWESLETTNNDFRRLLYMSSHTNFVQHIIRDFTALAEALLQRDCDQACHVYQSHLDQLSAVAKELTQTKESFFVRICASA